MKRPIAYMLVLTLILSALPTSSSPGPTPDPEIIIGTQVWSYRRVFPLLDGLFQDVANTQIQSLSRCQAKWKATMTAAPETAGFPDHFDYEGASLNTLRSTADW
jgi:hypothetical protein